MSRLFLLSLLVCSCLADVRYDGYKVLRMNSVNDEQREVLQLLANTFDFWDFPRDLMVPPTQLERTLELLDTHNIDYVVWIEDVQAKIDGVFTNRGKVQLTEFDYNTYHPLNEIMDWIVALEAEYPALVTSFVIGNSYEGRDLVTMKVGVDTGKPKRAFWFNGAIHAREWISPATVMWMTNKMIQDYMGADPDVTFLLEAYDFYILTVMNPDGYLYTWTDDRMWRKTRSPNDGSICIGTDPNRNFDYEWGGLGASDVPCSSTYRGAYPLSESEVEHVVNFIRNQSAIQPFDMYIDYHSYSQLMLSAWGYTYDLPADYDAMYAHMEVYTDGIFSVHGMVYEYGNAASINYPASGGSKDWGYGDRGIVYSYTVELRDTGEYGFLLPEDQIQPTAEENYVGLIDGCIHIAGVVGA